MSGMTMDQLHRSTLGIYSNLMEEFNPSLQKLVSLGNSYVRAFHTLAATSEAYFTALAKIGEQAVHSSSSQTIGDVLVQISESQRRLSTQLESVFHWFTVDVLQEMDNNVRQDKTYISSSRKHYEMEVREQAGALERSRRRGANQDAGGYLRFLRESHSEALQEEERRYRFVAEKHCSLIQSFTGLMNKTGGSLQQRADFWTEEVNATRGAADGQTFDNVGTNEDFRKPRQEEPLGRLPSRPPSPQGSVFNFTVESVRAKGTTMRALVDHRPAGSDATVLSFSRGDTITALTQQSRNGWLFGSQGSRKGWFPASYAEEVDDSLKSDFPRTSSPRITSSRPTQDRQSSNSQSGGQPPPPPPPPPPPSMDAKPIRPSSDRRTESNLESKKEQQQKSLPELFPRGTNPFATVKLKPTYTNDRSAPR